MKRIDLRGALLKLLSRPIIGPVIPVLAFAGIWELLRAVHYFGLFPEYLLPPPTEILARFLELMLNGTLTPHLAASLTRAAIGYLLAVLIAIPLGLLLGWYRGAYKVMEPIIELLRPIPAVGLVGFGLLVFGIGSAPIVFITFYGCFFILFIATLYGTYSIDETTVLVVRSMRATSWDVFRVLIVPSSLPYIFGGLRQALATAWILVVAGEMVIGSVGLGFYIVETQRTFQTAGMYATLALLGILGYVSTRLLLAIENRLVRWRKAQQAILQ